MNICNKLLTLEKQQQPVKKEWIKAEFLRMMEKIWKAKIKEPEIYHDIHRDIRNKCRVSKEPLKGRISD